MDAYDRPWMPDSLKYPSKKKGSKSAVLVPIKGAEFLLPTKAFYCKLCGEFAGDSACAEAHLKSNIHHKNYMAYVEENNFYEQRYNLDRAAGLSRMKVQDDRDDVNVTDDVDDKKEREEKKKSQKREPVKVEVTEKKKEDPGESVKVEHDEKKHDKRQSVKGEKDAKQALLGKFRFIMPLPKYRKSKGQLTERKEETKNPKEEPANLDNFLSISSSGSSGSTRSVPVQQIKATKKSKENKAEKSTESTEKSSVGLTENMVDLSQISLPPMGPTLPPVKTETLGLTVTKKSFDSPATVADARNEWQKVSLPSSIEPVLESPTNAFTPAVCYAPALGAGKPSSTTSTPIPVKPIPQFSSAPLSLSYMYAPALGAQKRRGQHKKEQPISAVSISESSSSSDNTKATSSGTKENSNDIHVVCSEIPLPTEVVEENRSAVLLPLDIPLPSVKTPVPSTDKALESEVISDIIIDGSTNKPDKNNKTTDSLSIEPSTSDSSSSANKSNSALVKVELDKGNICESKTKMETKSSDFDHSSQTKDGGEMEVEKENQINIEVKEELKNVNEDYKETDEEIKVKEEMKNVNEDYKETDEEIKVADVESCHETLPLVNTESSEAKMKLNQTTEESMKIQENQIHVSCIKKSDTDNENTVEILISEPQGTQSKDEENVNRDITPSKDGSGNVELNTSPSVRKNLKVSLEKIDSDVKTLPKITSVQEICSELSRNSEKIDPHIDKEAKILDTHLKVKEEEKVVIVEQVDKPVKTVETNSVETRDDNLMPIVETSDTFVKEAQIKDEEPEKNINLVSDDCLLPGILVTAESISEVRRMSVDNTIVRNVDISDSNVVEVSDFLSDPVSTSSRPTQNTTSLDGQVKSILGQTNTAAVGEGLLTGAGSSVTSVLEESDTIEQPEDESEMEVSHLGSDFEIVDECTED